VCLDTCHVFAAGYALGTDEEYEETFDQFGKTIGIKQLKLCHLNASVKPFQSRVDRHAAIGQGCIGLEPFRRLVNDSRFKKLPMILETPKENDSGKAMDPINLGILRGLAKEPVTNRPG
jgi:deoxyribonuclease-4